MILYVWLGQIVNDTTPYTSCSFLYTCIFQKIAVYISNIVIFAFNVNTKWTHGWCNLIYYIQPFHTVFSLIWQKFHCVVWVLKMKICSEDIDFAVKIWMLQWIYGFAVNIWILQWKYGFTLDTHDNNVITSYNWKCVTF